MEFEFTKQCLHWRGSVGLSSGWVDVSGGPPPLFVHSLLCAGCGLGEGQLCQSQSKQGVVSMLIVKQYGFVTFCLKCSSCPQAASWVPVPALWVTSGRLWVPPACFLGVSWLPLGAFWASPACFLRAAQVPPHHDSSPRLLLHDLFPDCSFRNTLP